METIIENLADAVANRDLAKAERARDELLLSREPLALVLHLLAETICYDLEDHGSVPSDREP